MLVVLVTGNRGMNDTFPMAGHRPLRCIEIHRLERHVYREVTRPRDQHRWLTTLRVE